MHREQLEEDVQSKQLGRQDLVGEELAATKLASPVTVYDSRRYLVGLARYFLLAKGFRLTMVVPETVLYPLVV